MCGNRNTVPTQSMPADLKFIESIINGMYDWVRVLDREDNILFINKSMSEAIGDSAVGKKCYVALGRTKPCENCTSRKAIFDGSVHEKEEVVNGRIYSVMASPIKDEQNKIIAVVEVLRDVTQTRMLQNQLIKQNNILQDDLNMAKKLQCSLLPKGLPDDKIKFSFLYRPCETLGGDFLDVFMIDRDNAGIYIADVSGHGVSASMLTVFLRSAMDKKTLSPSAALTKLYHEFNRSDFDPDFYITVFFGVINLKTQTMTYSNAGHNVCPILFNSDRFDILMSPGIPISNWLENPGYVENVVSLKSGDRLFLYTDGIIEMKNPKGLLYGEEQLLDILLNSNSEPNGTLKEVLENAIRFAQITDTKSIPDDITLALLEII